MLDIDTIPHITPRMLDRYRLLNIPSYGLSYTDIEVGLEQIVMLDQRMEGLSITSKPGLYITYLPLPDIENYYRQDLFGAKRPKHLSALNSVCIDHKKTYPPLDSLVESDGKILKAIKSFILEHFDTMLIGYHASPTMERLAQSWGIPFLGNSLFSQTVGGKIGLHEFLIQYQLPHLDTFIATKRSEFDMAINALRRKGYLHVVVKSNYSSMGLGHTILSTDEFALDKEFEQENCIVQGWIPLEHQHALFAFDVFITLDLEGSLVHIKSKRNASGLSNIRADYVPPNSNHLELIQPYINTLIQGLIQARAFGHHSFNCMILNQAGAHKYGLSSEIPYIHDANPRVGASRLSLAWLQAIREGHTGIGWVDRKTNVNPYISVVEVWKRLEQHRLLIGQTGKDAQGIFPYNSICVQNGVPKIHLLSVSASRDINHAQQMIDEAEQLLQA